MVLVLVLRPDLASNVSRSIVLCRLRFEVTSGLYKVFATSVPPPPTDPRANCCRDFRAILSAWPESLRCCRRMKPSICRKYMYGKARGFCFWGGSVVVKIYTNYEKFLMAIEASLCSCHSHLPSTLHHPASALMACCYY